MDNSPYMKLLIPVHFTTALMIGGKDVEEKKGKSKFFRKRVIYASKKHWTKKG